ncbi:response regulator transcription factor [Paenibacillus illinoisensis]|uniref:response regulator transcription factor n=1 Tax=Paenibacillus illinoisensis TaxID=59845 RepID=UPI003D96D2D1
MNLTAMIVDDELPILENLRLILPWEDMGIEITGTARSGIEALDKVADCHPDIMLCDIRMPTMDGLELIRILRERGESCEIILLTGYQQFEYARTAIRYNVHEYICKPIDYSDLENKLRELTEQIIQKRVTSESERHRSIEMENWIRHKHVTDLLRGEKENLTCFPVQSSETLPSADRYVLILVDAEGYFRHSIGWTADQHQQWHDEIHTNLRDITEIIEGSLITHVRKGEWGILLKASLGWESRADQLAQRIQKRLNAIFAVDSAMKARIILDDTPVCLDHQIIERYRHCQKQSASRPSVSEWIKSACEYMDTHLDHDLGIDEVADWLGISSSYFCQLFKSHVGVTFVEYMTQKRMETAAMLLSTTEWSITSIGEATGYKERRYFSKVFHKHFHMKPSEYRQSHRIATSLEEEMQT